MTANAPPAEQPPVFPISLLCLSASWGGLEINTVCFANWMRERGWPVQLITLPRSPIFTEAVAQQIPVVALRNPWKAVDLPAAGQLAKLLRQSASQALIVTRNGDLGLAVLGKTLHLPALRLVYQQHMQLGISKRGLLHTLRYRALDAWLSPLPGLARQVLDKTRFPVGRLHVVPLGIEVEKYLQASPSQDQARAQLSLSLPPKAILLGLIGRFDDGKGQDFVVTALAGLRRLHPHLHLLLVGEPTRNEGNAYYDAVLARIQQLHLADVVHVRGFTSQPEVAYRALDIAVVASTNETYGMVTLEAMATGLPVVAAAAGGSLELLTHEETGLHFPVGDAAGFSEAIARLVNFPTLGHRLGQAAQRRVQATFAHHQQCASTEAVLHGDLPPGW